MRRPTTSPPPQVRLTNTGIARIILALMAVVAVTAAIFMVATTHLRWLMHGDVRPRSPYLFEYVLFIAGVFLLIGMVYTFWASFSLRVRRKALEGSEPQPPDTAERMSFVAGVLQVIALVGLATGMMMVRFSRQELPADGGAALPSKKIADGGARPGPVAMRPSELTALGYLPPDCQIVAGWHVAAMRAQPEGKRLLTELRNVPLGPGVPQIEKWTGVSAGDVDQFALGVRLQQGMPQFVLAMRAARPLDPKKAADNLGIVQAEEHQGRPVLRVRLRPFGEGLIWFRDEHTGVAHFDLLAVKLEDLKAHPAKPHRAGEALSPVLRELIDKRLSPEALLWAAGDLREAPGLVAALSFLNLRPEARKLLGEVQFVTTGVRLQNGITWEASFRLKDAAAAAELTEVLKSFPPPDVEQWAVFGPEAGKKANTGDDTWVAAQARLSEAQLQQALTELKKRAHEKKN